MVDLNEIRVFVKVAEVGSFNGAAKTLGMPNSTVSAKVSALERRLGVTLLQRTTRKLRLTDAGKLFYSESSDGLVAIQEAEKRVQSGQSEPRGKLRVTAPADMGSGLFAELVSAYFLEFPKVSLEFHFTDRFVDLIGEGVDVGIRAGELKDSGLIAKRLGISVWALFATPGYLRKVEPIRHPKDLKGKVCALFTPFETDTWALFNKRSSITLPAASRFIGNDVNLVKALCLRGEGIALLPTYSCRAEEKSGKLERVLPDWRGSVDPISIVYPAQRFMPPHLRGFIRLAEGIFGEQLVAE